MAFHGRADQVSATTNAYTQTSVQTSKHVQLRVYGEKPEHIEYCGFEMRRHPEHIVPPLDVNHSVFSFWSFGFVGAGWRRHRTATRIIGTARTRNIRESYRNISLPINETGFSNCSVRTSPSLA